MTVKELIDELMQYPLDMEVFIEVPRRKLYQPLHEFNVGKGCYDRNDKYVSVVSLRRGKLIH